MRDQLLFIVAPYVVTAAFLPVSLARWALARKTSPVAGPSIESSSAVAALWRWTLGLVLAGHLILVASPASVLLWNRQPLRLLALETAGLAVGIAAMLSFAVTIVERGRGRRPAGRSPLDIVAGTLVALALTTGLALAVRYRWASSWSAVTLSPYLLTLVNLKPSVVLIASMPFLVRLHVLCTYALVGVAPFTSIGRVVTVPLDALIRWLTGPVGEAFGPAWRAVGAWSLKGVNTVLVRHGGEEN